MFTLLQTFRCPVCVCLGWIFGLMDEGRGHLGRTIITVSIESMPHCRYHYTGRVWKMKVKIGRFISSSNVFYKRALLTPEMRSTELFRLALLSCTQLQHWALRMSSLKLSRSAPFELPKHSQTLTITLYWLLIPIYQRGNTTTVLLSRRNSS